MVLPARMFFTGGISADFLRIGLNLQAVQNRSQAENHLRRQSFSWPAGTFGSLAAWKQVCPVSGIHQEIPTAFKLERRHLGRPTQLML